ncbi:hypothetical protein WUBG_19201 [Wuchereria bancrofti]|uniref:S1 motif domain-containing protein n=1 Tax=Wuchereria bancrofti TaxID=6293 RepID=J9E3B1_WUCBA|nr:hypothetical protein WUBG_19201 [Wuchereria bancrofti]
MAVHSRRYIPQKGDRVIGIVTSTHGETFKIDIGSADIAFISFLSFEGLIAHLILHISTLLGSVSD